MGQAQGQNQRVRRFFPPSLFCHFPFLRFPQIARFKGGEESAAPTEGGRAMGGGWWG